MLERIVDLTCNSSNIHEVIYDNNNHYRSIVIDAIRMNHDYLSESSQVDEELNIDASVFLNF
jgi:hypothetical protein